MDDVYEGNSFSITRDGSRWEIYRLFDDGADTGREALKLSTEAMDELDAYFTSYYREDRAEIAAKREP